MYKYVYLYILMIRLGANLALNWVNFMIYSPYVLFLELEKEVVFFPTHLESSKFDDTLRFY